MSPLHPQALFAITSYSHSALFSHCEYAWQPLLNLKKYLNSTIGNIHTLQIPKGVHLVNTETIFIGPDTTLEPGSWIEGPCILGRGCQVRHGAYIRGYVVTGDYCVIGHTTEVKHAILLNHVHAAHFAYVGDSILGHHVNLGAGVKCANLKFDSSDVSIYWQGQRYPTGMRKLGAMIGDGAQIGCNAVTNPGTLVGPKACWYPCVNSGGVIAAAANVR